MLRNYVITAFRNLTKSKLDSFINIFGLTVAIAVSIIIFLFANNELSFDKNHENAESIYLVYKERITPTGTQISEDTWLPLAEGLKNDYPNIINATRVWSRAVWVHNKLKLFKERVTYADPSLLEMFTLPLNKATPSSIFSDIHSVVISRKIAQKYFDHNDPIGQSITIDYTTDYIIRGVLDDIPENSTIQIDILALLESAAPREENEGPWQTSFLSTYIQVSPGTKPALLENQFPAFVSKIWGKEIITQMKLKLVPLLDLHNKQTGADTVAYILIGIALAILVIASINFMNLATARSVGRAREIGIRKVLGASPLQLIGQFLIESLILSAISLILGIGLMEVLLPLFNALSGASLDLDYLANISTILSLIGLSIIVGIFAGFYPAFFISKFQTAESIKGKLKSSAAGLRLRHSMVVIQFLLAIILILGTVTMFKQIHYMQNANLNFDKENIIAIPVQLSDFENREWARLRLESLRNEIKQHTNIKSICSSSHIPGRGTEAFTFAYPTDREDSQRLRVRRCFVDASYFKTYGIEFTEGRDFSEELATDAEQSVIINEAALRDIGWHSAKDHHIRVGNYVYNVIGVVKNYHYESLVSEVGPVLHFYLPSDSDLNQFISVKINSQNVSSTLAFIRDCWHNINAMRSLDFFFVDENFNRLYETVNRLITAAGSFTILAILISCLGLFALTSLMMTQRTKEIGVRKILGASVTNIVLMLHRDIIKFVVIAFVLACPIAYYAISKLLQIFAYRINIAFDIFLLAFFIAIGVAFITISYQAIQTARANPVEALRYE